MISKAHHEAIRALITAGHTWLAPDAPGVMLCWLHCFHRDVAIAKAKRGKSPTTNHDIGVRSLFEARLFDIAQLFDGEADPEVRGQVAAWLHSLRSDYADGLAHSLLSSRLRQPSAARVSA